MPGKQLNLLIPNNEGARLQALREHCIFGTPPEERFDRIVAKAALQFDVPIAAFTLINEERLWFKSKIGLQMQEAERSVSFCAHAVAINAPLVIEDTLKDIAFSGSRHVVDPPFIRFYAGVPVKAENKEPLGTLCIIDTSPRSLPWQDYLRLQKLARQMEAELQHRKSLLAAH